MSLIPIFLSFQKEGVEGRGREREGGNEEVMEEGREGGKVRERERKGKREEKEKGEGRKEGEREKGTERQRNTEGGRDRTGMFILHIL